MAKLEGWPRPVKAKQIVQTTQSFNSIQAAAT
ncbi:hypothetical protein CCACVL1_08964 [Corchorus capsularis]|uniref:Uncharacterized protein n=1 Tax=Corchorus capsularis TaxID=210143 RepID=A0A1R3IY61_COCAP|nr:hypothetical protein CCACVL1_08964 [Corchorus capsularis]